MTSATARRPQGLRFDAAGFRILVDGRDVFATMLELKLLNVFLKEPGVAFTRAEILDEVWGVDVVVTDRVVDTHVMKLRRKLGRFGACLVSVLGYGYRWDAPAEEVAA